VLCGLPLIKVPDLLVGMEEPDDAGVYKITDEIALIQTLDFFTPLVDDPYLFGQIAACNSLSDVYAMGGRPLTCMNILCFPIKKLGVKVAREIIRGGLEKIQEAGAVLVGGHSVLDDELKYGLSVTGIIHPGRILTKGGAQAGDRLILTKPLGTGVISTALKGDMASGAAISSMAHYMTTLNRKASEIASEAGVHACTDVTGFGFIGHLHEILHYSQRAAHIDMGAIPFMEGALEYAAMGLLPGGLARNRDFYEAKVKIDGTVDNLKVDLLYDPQTSGGLLISVPPDKAEDVLKKLISEGIATAAVVGEIQSGPAGEIVLRREEGQP
jgi:selenide, water dikinase